MLQKFDEAELERLLAAAAHSWADDFEGAMVDQFGDEQGTSLLRRYADCVPGGLQGGLPPHVSPRRTCAGWRRSETEPVGLSLYAPVDAEENETRFKVFREDAPLSLSAGAPRAHRTRRRGRRRAALRAPPQVADR